MNARGTLKRTLAFVGELEYDNFDRDFYFDQDFYLEMKKSPRRSPDRVMEAFYEFSEDMSVQLLEDRLHYSRVNFKNRLLENKPFINLEIALS